MTILSRRHALHLFVGAIFAAAGDAAAQSDYRATLRHVAPQKAAAAAEDILANPGNIESFSLPRHDKPDKYGLYHIYALCPTGVRTKELVHLPVPDGAIYQTIKAKALASLGRKCNNTAKDMFFSDSLPRLPIGRYVIPADSLALQ